MSDTYFQSLCRRLAWLTGRLESREAKWLYGIAVLGLAVRLLAAWLQPAFVDEGAVYYLTKAGWQAMAEVFRFEKHPPTYNALMYPLISVCGSIFLLRLPAVFLYLLTLGGAYQLCRRCFSVPLSLLLAACGATGYSVWILEAQLRSYGPLMFCLTWFWLGLADICEGRSPYRDNLGRHASWGWRLFAAAVLGADSLHILGAVITFSCLLAAGRLESELRRNTWVCILAGAIPVALWYVWLQSNTHAGGAITWQGVPWQALLAIPLSLLNFFNSDSILFCFRFSAWQTQYGSALSFAYGVGNLLLWLLLMRGWVRMRRRLVILSDMLFLSWALPLSILAAAASMGMMSLQPRYAVVMVLPFALLLAEGFADDNIRRRALSVLLGWNWLLLLVFPFVPGLWNQYWQSSIDFIEAQSRPGDILAVYVPYAGFSFAWAYDAENAEFDFGDKVFGIRQRATADKLPIILLSQDVFYRPGPQELQYLAKRRMFLVLNQADQNGPPRWLSEHYRIVDHRGHRSIKYWADVEVFLLEWTQ